MHETPPRHSRSGSTRLADTRRQPLPPGAGRFGMTLFLAALTMLFGATMVGYVIVRLRGEPGAGPGTLALPWQLWVSTAVILISSFTIHRALQNVRAERQTRFGNALTMTLMLGIGFLLLQGPAMATLLFEHFGRQNVSIALYGFVFTMVLLHALHVVGGLIPLAVVTVKAHRQGYDHESHAPVEYLTMYWHFLDGVWLIMFFVLQIAG